MTNFVFISRHAPTEAQCQLASKAGVVLHHFGDIDAFDDLASHNKLHGYKREGFAGIVCVHPVIALLAYQAGLVVGVFQNINRAAAGDPLRFECGMFKLFTPHSEATFTP